MRAQTEFWGMRTVMELGGLRLEAELNRVRWDAFTHRVRWDAMCLETELGGICSQTELGGMRSNTELKANNCTNFGILLFRFSEVRSSREHELNESGEKGMGAGNIFPKEREESISFIALVIRQCYVILVIGISFVLRQRCVVCLI